MTGGDGNVISGNNGSDGVAVVGATATGNAILANSIFSNARPRHRPRRRRRHRRGPRRRRPRPEQPPELPILSAVTTNGTRVHIAGSLRTVPGSYRVEFFAHNSPDPAGFGEGARYLGFQDVTTGDGNAVIYANLTAAVAAGTDYVTATATNLVTNDTSEFARNLTAVGELIVTTTASAADARHLVDRGAHRRHGARRPHLPARGDPGHQRRRGRRHDTVRDSAHRRQPQLLQDRRHPRPLDHRLHRKGRRRDHRLRPALPGGDDAQLVPHHAGVGAAGHHQPGRPRHHDAALVGGRDRAGRRVEWRRRRKRRAQPTGRQRREHDPRVRHQPLHRPGHPHPGVVEQRRRRELPGNEPGRHRPGPGQRPGHLHRRRRPHQRQPGRGTVTPTATSSRRHRHRVADRRGRLLDCERCRRAAYIGTDVDRRRRCSQRRSRASCSPFGARVEHEQRHRHAGRRRRHLPATAGGVYMHDTRTTGPWCRNDRDDALGTAAIPTAAPASRSTRTTANNSPSRCCRARATSSPQATGEASGLGSIAFLAHRQHDPGRLDPWTPASASTCEAVARRPSSTATPPNSGLDFPDHIGIRCGGTLAVRCQFDVPAGSYRISTSTPSSSASGNGARPRAS